MANSSFSLDHFVSFKFWVLFNSWFPGFIVQVQDEEGNPIGEFDIPEEMEDFKSYQCGGSAGPNMVAHNNPKVSKVQECPFRKNIFDKNFLLKQ